MLFLQRPDRGNGDNPFDAELFEAVNIGSEIQLGRKNAMSASVTRQEGDPAALERAQDISIRRLWKQSEPNLKRFGSEE